MHGSTREDDAVSPAKGDEARPIRLQGNPVPLYYAGGRQIAKFRGLADFPSPEDWVGSRVSFNGGAGRAKLPSGDVVADLLRSDPHAWFGAHATDTGPLVKLLDAGERLPVHWHPHRSFARTHLGSRHGKAEAWVVLSEEPTTVWFGLRGSVTADDFREAIDAQVSEALLALMNTSSVERGDVIFVPPGVVHALGEGILVLELQEPTSFSLLAEHESLGLTSEQAALGIGWETALESLDLSPDANDPGRWIARGAALRHGAHELLPPAAHEYFRCVSVFESAASIDLGRLSVVVGVSGVTHISGRDMELSVRGGETWLVPAAFGDATCHTDGQCLVAQPSS